VIRQAISCDLCGIDKRQTNHWYVAYEQAGELRIGDWTSRHRLHADSKHLCGQKCLHRLVDDFIARTVASRTKIAMEGDGTQSAAGADDCSLTTGQDFESSARLVLPLQQSAPPSAFHHQFEAVAFSEEQRPKEAPSESPEPTLRSSRSWYAEAWQRERERELRAADHHPEIASRRRSNFHFGF